MPIRHLQKKNKKLNRFYIILQINFKNNSKIDKKSNDSVLVSTNNNSKYLSTILSEMVGIQPKIAHSNESLCNSGTNSIVSAFSYISSGLAEMVLVTGAERVDSRAKFFNGII